MKLGRPTDYNEAILAKANEYLVNFETEHKHAIPSIAGLAKVLGKNRDTLYQWAKEEDKKDFSDILRQIVSDQELVLINKGLQGDFNSNITKLVLGKHGYHEKKDTNIKAKIDLTDLTEDELDRKLLHLESLSDQSD